MSSNQGPGFNPQAALLDTLLPGFSVLSATVYRHLKIDLSKYVPYILASGASIFALRYSSSYLWSLVEDHLMSTADIRVDDEMYNIFMSWLTNQHFAKKSRNFVANTNVNSRHWQLIMEDRLVNAGNEKDEEVEFEDADGDLVLTDASGKKKKREIHYTPSFGRHYFWYNGHFLLFKRERNSAPPGFLSSEHEEISVSCFGRNPEIIKDLLDECRLNFMKQDENKTSIYRGGSKSGSTDVTWTRSMSRISRPFSTVVLDESVKKSLLDDLKEYLHPYTRRWYSNRGIPYRRGYLLYGPPGTGKSSLSFAIAGYFRLKIYIVSLNSQLMSEENLSTLFASLPQRCVVLLEDIDTAGLTHTRDDNADKDEETKPPAKAIPNQLTPLPEKNGRLSLSALLNVIDGVASQEGRVLIMTTNHIDKLDEALIRPGRVDMMIEFHLATTQQLVQIFESIFATMEGDSPISHTKTKVKYPNSQSSVSPRSMHSTSYNATLLGANGTTLSSEMEGIKKIQRMSDTANPSQISKAQDSKGEEARISAFAKSFAATIPSGEFSPAEVQGFLLKWKRDPEMAVKMAPAWVEEMRTKKKKNHEKDVNGLKSRGNGVGAS